MIFLLSPGWETFLVAVWRSNPGGQLNPALLTITLTSFHLALMTISLMFCRSRKWSYPRRQWLPFDRWKPLCCLITASCWEEELPKSPHDLYWPQIGLASMVETSEKSMWVANWRKSWNWAPQSVKRQLIVWPQEKALSVFSRNTSVKSALFHRRLQISFPSSDPQPTHRPGFQLNLEMSSFDIDFCYVPFWKLVAGQWSPFPGFKTGDKTHTRRRGAFLSARKKSRCKWMGDHSRSWDSDKAGDF